jgi:hypothetical protein
MNKEVPVPVHSSSSKSRNEKKAIPKKPLDKKRAVTTTKPSAVLSRKKASSPATHEKNKNANPPKPVMAASPGKISPLKISGATKAKSPLKLPPADNLRQAITFFYLLSFCPPERAADFMQNTLSNRQTLAASAGMNEAEYFEVVIPEVCRRIISYHQASREPDPAKVWALAETTRQAYSNPARIASFQEQMILIAALPGRAKPENRLHRNKGCALCRSACRYGYFSLVSEPPIWRLQDLLSAESDKPTAGQSALGPLYNFTLGHLTGQAGGQKIYIDIRSLVDLSYCMLMLGMAKSRLATPFRQLELLQGANLEYVRNYK